MKNEKNYEHENNNTINEMLEHVVASYLRGILLLGGLITVGLGSMFFGDKVIGVGVIILLCGLFYHSFGGLIRKCFHLALAAIALVGATAHLGVSMLATMVREKLSDTRTKSKEKSPHAGKAKAESEEGEIIDSEEPVFKRVVLDGDIEQEADAEATFVAAMKPKFKGAKSPEKAAVCVVSNDDEEEILRAGIDKDDEVFCGQAAESDDIAQTNMFEEVPTGFIPNDDIPDENIPPEEIPDEVTFAHEDLEDSVVPVTVRPRKVSTKRLPNGARIIVRAASND